MTNDKEIRLAVAILKDSDLSRTLSEVQTLLDLATAYLNVEGLPEKKGHECSTDCMETVTCKYAKENETLDLCKVVIARDYVKRDEVEKLRSALKDCIVAIEEKYEQRQSAVTNARIVLGQALNSDIIKKES